MPNPPNRSYDVRRCETVLIGEGIEIGVLNVHEAFEPSQVLRGEAAHYVKLGLQYLDRGDYDLARSAFERSLDRALGEPELHYYLALALLAGRRPHRLQPADVKQIERHLMQAARTSGSGHVQILHAFVKQEYYIRNCLRLQPPTPTELLRAAATSEIPLSRLQELQRHTPIEGWIRELPEPRRSSGR